jgi:hypothetical protein
MYQNDAYVGGIHSKRCEEVVFMPLPKDHPLYIPPDLLREAACKYLLPTYLKKRKERYEKEKEEEQRA